MLLETDQDIIRLLTATKRIALVGASAKPERASNRILKFLLDQGYDVVPVHPGLVGQQLHGVEVVESLAAITGSVDMVDIFRRSSQAGEAVDDAIRIGAKSVWMQLDVIDQDAANRAEQAGLTVIMDRCPVIEYRRLGI